MWQLERFVETERGRQWDTVLDSLLSWYGKCLHTNWFMLFLNAKCEAWSLSHVDKVFVDNDDNEELQLM